MMKMNSSEIGVGMTTVMSARGFMQNINLWVYPIFFIQKFGGSYKSHHRKCL